MQGCASERMVTVNFLGILIHTSFIQWIFFIQWICILGTFLLKQHIHYVQSSHSADTFKCFFFS